LQKREYRRIRRGWCYGEEAFRKELLGQMVGRAGENHYAEEQRESDAEKARRIVAAELKRLNWTESELRGSRKGDAKKVRIARRLREKTTTTLKWIAGELYMGGLDARIELAIAGPPWEEVTARRPGAKANSNLCQKLGPTPSLHDAESDTDTEM